MKTISWVRTLLASFFLVGAAPLAADMIGQDAPACSTGRGPAIQANIVGLKDRIGEVWLELYPATEADFLRSDEALLAEGKTFRRARSPLPASGAVSICVRVPRPGRYALLLRHNRVGKDKFSLLSDGAGFPSNERLGRSKPKHSQALIEAGPGITVANIRVQYLRGLGGFGPL
jgi:uncharacterized protein (DUF2141 family)